VAGPARTLTWISPRPKGAFSLRKEYPNAFQGLNYGADARILSGMADINSEFLRLRDAAPMNKVEVYESICKNFSAGAIASAISALVTPAPGPRPGKAERGGRPSSVR